MFFTSSAFWGFFAIVFIVYWCLPPSWRWACLLLADIGFYCASGTPQLCFALLIPMLCSYAAARCMPLAKSGGIRKALLIGGIIACLSFLLFYKYSLFLVQSIAAIFGIPALQSGGVTTFLLGLALPLGISYYTLQTISYLVDVWRGDAVPEKHFGLYAVSVSFFPLMLTGPIERPAQLLCQLHAPPRFEYERAMKGAILVLWGLFEKLSVANIIGSFVDAAYNDPAAVTGMSLLAAALLYSIQIYCDFAGYSNIARGTAALLGLEVTQNFRHPYFAASIREFWADWHISLSQWLRNYIYIPLGGNRKGKPRQLLNLMVVFLVSGLWHGANLCFLVWGALHGLYEVFGALTAPVRETLCRRCKINREAWYFRIWRVAFIFIIVSFAWIFFRVGSSTSAAAPAQLSTVMAILQKIAADFSLDLQSIKDALTMLKMDYAYLFKLIYMIAMVLFVDWKSRKTDVESWILSLRPVPRLALCWLIAFTVLFLGVDTGAPIYFKF